MMGRIGFAIVFFFFFQAEDGIRDYKVTGVQTCALPIFFRLADLIGARPIPEADPELVRGGDIFHLVGDAAKLRAATGWVLRYTLDDTLREVLDAQAD